LRSAAGISISWINRPVHASTSVNRGLTKRWLRRGSGDGEPQPPETRIEGARAPLLDRLLAARGLSDPAAVRRFCDPKLSDLHDPSRLPNLDAAAAALVEAVRGGRSIVIYGDYDVDGVTAAAMLLHIIRAVKPDANVRTYLPHRLEEGYGLNRDALRQLRAAGADLVVSVDCGISAHEPARVARELGLRLIITDHHAIPADGALPDADLIVHPRLPGEGEPYPFGELCGAGVAFKLAWRFAALWCNSSRVSEQLQHTLMAMLPLAAMGTIADVVPLVGENRVIARYGLRLIKQTPLVGLRTLIEVSGLMEEDIDCEKVGFVLAPRLNACGRMGHAAEALRLLITSDAAEARAISLRLNEANQERQATERRILDHAARLAEDAGMTGDDRRIIVLADPAWHPGVVGIVCSRLAERFGRPTILLQTQADLCKGSARSIDGYSIHEGLLAAREHLETFGGHDAAAGLTLRPQNLDAFINAITEHANARIEPEQLVAAVRIDCDAALGELELEVVKKLAALSPFGRGNPRPSLRVQGLTIAEAPKQMGGQGRHLSMNVRDELANERRWLRCVWWNQGSLAADLAAGMRIDAVIEPRINHWNGRTSVEAEVKDVRVGERIEETPSPPGGGRRVGEVASGHAQQ
jgi:single-stranded-DNA-specific exonuclease